MSLSRALPALLLLAATGCGSAPDEGPAAAPPEMADSTLAGTADTAGGIGSVDLPADFPTDFPIAPDSRIVSATTTEDAGGAFSEISIESGGEPGAGYQWYRKALTDAGWQLASEGQTDETRTLHAVQGDSYVDLTVLPDADAAAGGMQVEAAIWKAGT
jgi:hypothetical protein